MHKETWKNAVKHIAIYLVTGIVLGTTHTDLYHFTAEQTVIFSFMLTWHLRFTIEHSCPILPEHSKSV